MVVGKGFTGCKEGFSHLHAFDHVFALPLDTTCRLWMYNTRKIYRRDEAIRPSPLNLIRLARMFLRVFAKIQCAYPY